MADMEFKDFVTHFSTKVSPAIVDFATNVAFLHSRYLFVRKEGKQQIAYCTHCRQEFQTQGLRQGKTSECPGCGSKCYVKLHAKGRSRMVDEAYFVYYEKSQINPQAITARGIYAIRDYRDSYRDVDTLFEVKAMYLFEPGQAVMFERPWLYYSDTNGMICGENWVQRKTVGSLMGSTMTFKPCFCSTDSIRKAVSGTPFQYSTWDQYGDRDWVRFFNLAAKYPCVEYLTKLGMSGLVEAKLNGNHTFGVVNWRGKNPLSVLKMSRQEMKELQGLKASVDPWLLYLRNLSKKDGSNLSLSELVDLQRDISEGYRNELDTALARTTLRRLHAYLNKQLARVDSKKYYSGKSRVLGDWNDYIRDCQRLGLDTTLEAVKFPSNLHRAHQNTIQQIKVKADEALQAKLAARLKGLQTLKFEHRGFLIRAAESTKELIEEGKALHHCVGTYVDRYAKGETDILVIRRASEPNKPFYTVEVRNGHVVQCRGLKNCEPTDEVKAFVELFVSKKLRTKNRTRVGIAV
ncbi:PcfJ domain-containing protein [Alicyclobacillus tolerans]|uniref:PcfJ domain-containing protein n=1 Tax=Alicyclobacillus tolerans TaxID=90970 RepID=UPI001F25562D|nr:PcfJ domain-containing protein [Alicyclobacillus tolerans]MCF8566881.1 PcfJ domain-containing protein [Alicyclobacillus tolerans]